MTIIEMVESVHINWKNEKYLLNDPNLNKHNCIHHFRKKWKGVIC